MPRKYKPFIDGFWEKVNTDGECWIWQACMRGGRLAQYGTYRGMIASRVSWELHHAQEVPKGMYVLHKCDNPACVRPDHLFLGTIKDNMVDMMRKQRKKTKITIEDVNKIRSLKEAGVVQRRIAEKYNVSPAYICLIVNNKQWAF